MRGCDDVNAIVERFELRFEEFDQLGLADSSAS